MNTCRRTKGYSDVHTKLDVYTGKEKAHLYSSAGLGNHWALYGIELTAGLGKPRREVEHVSYFETTSLLFFLLGLAGGSDPPFYMSDAKPCTTAKNKACINKHYIVRTTHFIHTRGSNSDTQTSTLDSRYHFTC